MKLENRVLVGGGTGNIGSATLKKMSDNNTSAWGLFNSQKVLMDQPATMADLQNALQETSYEEASQLVRACLEKHGESHEGIPSILEQKKLWADGKILLADATTRITADDVEMTLKSGHGYAGINKHPFVNSTAERFRSMVLNPQRDDLNPLCNIEGTVMANKGLLRLVMNLKRAGEFVNMIDLCSSGSMGIFLDTYRETGDVGTAFDAAINSFEPDASLDFMGADLAGKLTTPLRILGHDISVDDIVDEDKAIIDASYKNLSHAQFREKLVNDTPLKTKLKKLAGNPVFLATADIKKGSNKIITSLGVVGSEGVMGALTGPQNMAHIYTENSDTQQGEFTIPVKTVGGPGSGKWATALGLYEQIMDVDRALSART